jgi:hypothetical protein
MSPHPEWQNYILADSWPLQGARLCQLVINIGRPYWCKQALKKALLVSEGWEVEC